MNLLTKKTALLKFGAAGMLSLLTACTNHIGFQRDVDAGYDATKARGNTALSKFDVDMEKSRTSITKVHGAWLGGKAMPIQVTRDLPAAMDDFVYTYSDKVSIATIASRITLLTGIPVRVQPDVFITTSQLLPANVGSQAPKEHVGLVPVPSLNSGQAQGLSGASATSGDFENAIVMPFHGRLSQFLDLITARAGISWEYRDNALYLFRLVTRTFTFKSLPGMSDIQATVGKTGTTNAGTQTAGGTSGMAMNTTSATFNGVSQSSSNIKISAWDSILDQVKTMLSRVGKVAINQATGSITVTDTKEIVENAGKLIEGENRKAMRQVKVQIEVLSFSTSDNNEFGLDWSLVNTKLSNLAPSWRLSVASPASSVSANAASIGYAVLQGDPNSPNRMNGSQALFKALRELGKTNLVTRTTRTTSNNQPTALAITDQTGYLAYTTGSTGVVGGSGGVPGLMPGTVTTGFILNMLPSIQENDGVLLQYSLDISELKSIDNQSSGGFTIQTPSTSGYSSYDRIGLKAGEVAVITAYERTSDGYNKRGVTPDAGFGSFAGKGSYQAVLLILTPVIVEGAI